jgi:hypothetical protein
MDIWNILDLEVGKRLILRKQVGQANGSVQILEHHSTTLIEGYSRQHNCIYGRVLHGQDIGQ